MNFSKIIGKCDPKIITDAEEKFSVIMAELSLKYSTKGYASKLGGDILLYQLIYPLPHICDARSIELENEKKLLDELVKNEKITSEEKSLKLREIKSKLGGNILYTAATNGKTYFWNPEFINKLSKVGVRLVVAHEGWHSIYMHPSRRGSRNPALWNISVDFKVNYTLLDDLKLRGFYNNEEVFRKELGDYATLSEYAAFLKDPYNPPAKLAGWNPIHSLKSEVDPSYKQPDEKSLYFADVKLSQEMKKPENIYDYLYSQIPKCSCCGRVGHYKKPDEAKKLIKQIKEMNKKELK